MLIENINVKLEKKYSSLINIIKKYGIVDLTAVKACFSLLSAGDRIDRECAERLGIYQLSESRFMILTLLFDHEILSPLEMAKLTGVTKPTITSLITSLEKDGLIKRSSVPSDGRKLEITLTEEGRELIEKLFMEHSQWIANITRNLTDMEMEALVQILDKMFQNSSGK